MKRKQNSRIYGHVPGVRSFMLAGVLASPGLMAPGCTREITLALLAPDEADPKGAEPDAAEDNVTPDDSGASPGVGSVDDDDRSARDGGMSASAADEQGESADADAGTTAMTATTGKLVHRYDFSGIGTTLDDRIGFAHGTILGGAMLNDTGNLTLDGTDDYIDLPNGLISRLKSVTVMAWLQWAGGVCWQRLFDFGSSDRGEDEVGNAETSLFFTPEVCGDAPTTAAALVEVGDNDYTANLAGPLPTNAPVQVAVTWDTVQGLLRVYVDGEQAAETAVPLQLAMIDDVNVWLGRSQWTQDYNLSATLDEFRIYGRALSASDIKAAFDAGPEVPWDAP